MGAIQEVSIPMTRRKPIKPDPQDYAAIERRLHNTKKKIIAMLERDLPEELEEEEAIRALEQIRAKQKRAASNCSQKINDFNFT